VGIHPLAAISNVDAPGGAPLGQQRWPRTAKAGIAFGAALPATSGPHDRLTPAIFGNYLGWKLPAGLEFDADLAGCLGSILVIL
jgi:hypothetical protein